MNLKSLVLSIPIAALAFASITPMAKASPKVDAKYFRGLTSTTLTWGGTAKADSGESGPLTVTLAYKNTNKYTLKDTTSPYKVEKKTGGVKGGGDWVVKATFKQNDG